MGASTTVIFTDLIGSTAVFEALGNARATQTVTQLTRWIREVCEAHGGRVVKTLGDGVLAVFPRAEQAIQAVVEMQREHQNRIIELPPAERMPIRVGVATGEVEVVDDDCYGDAVNIASRLNDLAGPDEILVNSTEVNYADREDGLQFRFLGAINVRGRSEACEVYQVEWNEDQPTELMTMLADPGAVEGPLGLEVQGQQIELAWGEEKKSFKAFELPVQIGRIYHSDFMVNDPRVSRTHARVEWRNGHIMLVDLSSYGTWVRFDGGSEVQLRRQECVLHGSGEMALGSSFADPAPAVVHFRIV